MLLEIATYALMLSVVGVSLALGVATLWSMSPTATVIVLLAAILDFYRS